MAADKVRKLLCDIVIIKLCILRAFLSVYYIHCCVVLCLYDYNVLFYGPGCLN